MRPSVIALVFVLSVSLAGAANTAMRYLSVADLPYVQAALSDARVLQELHKLVARRRYVVTGVSRLARQDGPPDRALIAVHLHDPEATSTDPDAQIDVVADAVSRRSGREFEVTGVAVRRHRSD